MGAFIEADIGKLESFVQQTQEVITEFEAIKEKFDDINTTLLTKWKGDGARAYKKETDDILEKIGGVKDELETINSEILDDIISCYDELDADLGEMNRNPYGSEE